MQSMSYHEVLINYGMLTCMVRLVLLKDGGSGCNLKYGFLLGLLVVRNRKSLRLAQTRDGTYLRNCKGKYEDPAVKGQNLLAIHYQ